MHSISVFAAAPTNSSSGMTSINYTKTVDHMLVQNLTKTNVPVTLPLTRGYVNGFEVFYISTEASDKGLADHLTNFTHSRVSFDSIYGFILGGILVWTYSVYNYVLTKVAQLEKNGNKTKTRTSS